jgi:hypothetical protein
MNAQQSWQKLIVQALTNTSVEVRHGCKCGPVCISEYIYRALNLAGINNRPPFGWYRIFSIWWQARGDADQIKLRCIQAIQQLQSPKRGFKPNSQLIELLSLALLSAALLPQAANTYIHSPYPQSILHIKPQPMEDIDSVEVSLPSSTDYIYAANQFLGKPVLFDKDQGLLLGKDWIHSQQDGSYSLQVISTSTKQAVFDFCKEHNICGESAYYQSQIKGKTYFRLLYGSYRNHKAAQQALATLPAKLQQLNPWPRNFKQIKSEI